MARHIKCLENQAILIAGSPGPAFSPSFSLLTVTIMRVFSLVVLLASISRRGHASIGPSTNLVIQNAPVGPDGFLRE